ncbi:CaiB/BaiF CoA transferase family protein [Candidimonas nitroreducens]|uniref:CoA transferase n=1 Tax=Candidimonas nitroreducens TaxID=683354 RepID=A0A225MHY3_9BURK|nr:CoA transferase [Candidimonas nitroreducens]OWT59111.1 CoA transferase [Candidimonas nitroreducens]
MEDAFGSLRGLVVLDLTQMLAGPFCSQMLADHGAEVLKIEPPGGDSTRQFGPFHPEDSLRSHGGYYQSVNRNKKSVVLDLKDKAGRNDFLALACQADIVVENFREGVMDRLGVGYDALSTVNPRLIYASVRGFGDGHGGSGASPYANWPAFDIVAQAMGGLIGITGQDKDSVVKVGPGVGDIMPGILAAFGILAAVNERHSSGKGQYIDVAMVDTMLALCERIVHQYSYAGAVCSPDGSHHPMFAPFGLFPARDGIVAIGCVAQHQWRTLCELMNRFDLRDDPAIDNGEKRFARREDITAAVTGFTVRHTKAELIELLGGKIPFGPVYDARDIFNDPHFRAREMLPCVAHPGLNQPLEIVGIPLKLSRTPGRIAHGAAQLGEHTDEVLARVRAQQS